MTLDEVILVAAQTAETYLSADKRHLIEEARQSARIMAWEAWKKKPTIRVPELRRVAYTGVVRAIRDEGRHSSSAAARRPVPDPATELLYREEIARLRQSQGPRAAYVLDLIVQGHTKQSVAERAKCHPATVTRIVQEARNACA